jgi:DNA-binding PadR family transcriptional regulator
MLSDPLTLYKLMILYMLKRVKFPLTNSQISEFFLSKEYTNYFTLQQALSELTDAHLIHVETTQNSTLYEITREGEDTLGFFGKKISDAIIKDMDDYLRENRVRMRDEVSTLADYYRSTNQDYVVHCEIREGRMALLELQISVPEQQQAEQMCSRWQQSSQTVYASLLKELMQDPD